MNKENNFWKKRIIWFSKIFKWAHSFNKCLFDTYCGTGTFLSSGDKQCKKEIGEDILMENEKQ